MVYEGLYGRDQQFVPRPLMVEGHVIEDDGKRWTMTLREGLLWHDGTKVLARDCVASLQRWLKRDATAPIIMARVEAFEAKDDRTLVWRLSRPFPLLAHFLSKVQPQPVMMPERLAATDPYKQMTEIVGCGPLSFLPDEYVSGIHAGFARFDGYVPRQEPPSYNAGGHQVNVDRVEWRVIPDVATAAAALTAGEVDWVELPQPDLIPMLDKAPESPPACSTFTARCRSCGPKPDRAHQQRRRAPRHAGRDRPEGSHDRRDGRGTGHLEGADGIYRARHAVRHRGGHGLPSASTRPSTNQTHGGTSPATRANAGVHASDRPDHLQRVHHRRYRAFTQDRHQRR